MHEHFIKLLVDARVDFERGASQRNLDSISDFVFGFSKGLGLPENGLFVFREWLGVELGQLKPSPMRGGFWIGDSFGWKGILLRQYDSPQAAYEGCNRRSAS